MNWDEEIVFQSKRLDLYRQVAEELVEKGFAYYCYTEEGSDECIEIPKSQIKGKKVAIKFRIPETGETEFDDLVHGHISFENKDLKDFVILKSDGYPTYQLAVVVDDHYMGMTHIIRGEDHIPNTPKQILIYRAMGWYVPEFAHLPMILGPDKKKLSKRHGATSVIEYRKQGFLAEALFNFLALLGWSPGGDREIVSKEEMIELFDIKRVGKRAAVFDMNKLRWMNSVYIRMKTDEELFELAFPFFQEAGIQDVETIRKIIPLYKERVVTLRDFVEMSSYFFTDEFDYDEKARRKWLSRPEVPGRLRALADRIETLERYDAESLEALARALAQELGIGTGQLFHPCRAAVTGCTVGPSLFHLMELLDQADVVRRLRRAADFAERLSQQS